MVHQNSVPAGQCSVRDRLTDSAFHFHSDYSYDQELAGALGVPCRRSDHTFCVCSFVARAGIGSCGTGREWDPP